MRPALTWMAVAVLCCASGAADGEARLVEAEVAFARAKELHAAGRYSEALVQGEHARVLREAVLGSSHPEVARCLDLLGVLHQLQGDPTGAESLLRRGLAIREAALGRSHPDVASSLDHLASLYKAQGAYEQAAPLYERALAIQEAALGKHHPAIASTLHNLALVFARPGSINKAEQAYARALKIVEVTQGRNHPYVAELLNDLARLRMADARLDDALPPLRRAFAISELRLRREALGFSESRLAHFIAHLRTQEELLYELLRAAPDDDDVRHLALTAALMRKGRSVEQIADTSRTAFLRVSAQDRDTFKRLRGLRSELASLSLQGPGPLTPGDYRQRLEELASRGDALEAELAMRSAPLRALTSLPPPEYIVRRVAAALPKSSVLVEFVAYMDRAILRKPGTQEPRTPQLRYLALVLFPDGHIRAADLGPAALIDSAAARMRDALANRDADFLFSTRELYQRVLRPLWRFLDGTQHVFLAPDGQLGLVPFAALHNGHQFLVDVHDFTYLTSGRDLMPRAWNVAPSQSVVVLADPDFNSPAPLPTDKTELAERSAPVERFFSTLRADVAERPWAPLPGTRGEAEAIQRMVPGAQLFLGPAATKERLLHVSAPGVLHLATHGFFLEDATVQEATRAVGHFGALGEDPHAASPADPLLRSGLILAGARAATLGASGADRPPPDNAMVTALELAGLNLWGTQLVVLSACDTGRGDVKLGQGVYGLRRAFIAAGAETVVMSLWKVNDAITRVLMEGYYRHLLAGQGRATALHQAMRELRRIHPHPHYWAPFITAGQNAPLRVLSFGPLKSSGK
ncbi:CHAT domain-containing protein [Pyxidicoccus fallax]|uniref:CHAT domain-containing protein n=1 Tax=Pyxidicoccus fallax TaxID=394095 RepID=A0A848L9I7_9BACT|nr:CHAT domain-containing tetratricopeptide repeat protein [Pyxidicoccus fallax]NMO13515.1 CHAT domain-containing protein [Pyxidicoccus fallax]NPC78534.1 CHAT domain-containing protein [Pyxidicoccus fallax]